MSELVKWTQWDRTGMFRCGHKDLKTLMGWMRELGADARKCLANQEKSHAVYGRIIYDKSGRVDEVRFYCDTYATDEELDKMAKDTAPDILYVAHKWN